jgi:hypothetical protein
VDAAQNETGPGTRTASIVGGKLFLTIFDNGVAEPAGKPCSHTMPDPELKLFRGAKNAF